MKLKRIATNHYKSEDGKVEIKKQNINGKLCWTAGIGSMILFPTCETKDEATKLAERTVNRQPEPTTAIEQPPDPKLKMELKRIAKDHYKSEDGRVEIQRVFYWHHETLKAEWAASVDGMIAGLCETKQEAEMAARKGLKSSPVARLTIKHLLADLQHRNETSDARLDPKEYKYTNLYAFVLTNAIPFDPQPLPEKYPRGLLKACYNNAYHLAKKHKLIYVEGFAFAATGVRM